MTIQAAHFTPEVLLLAPRRSAGVPNSTGELVLYTVSSYSFETHSKSSSIRVLNVDDGSSHVVSEDATASDPVWISDKEVLYFKAGENGCACLWAKHVADGTDPRLVYCAPGSLASLKAQALVGQQEPKSHSTAKVYASLFVRHWDAWTTENKSSLWYGQLARVDGKWTLEGDGLTNLLAGTPLVSPVPPFGGTGDFDVASDAICFVARDPGLNPATHTKTDLYYVPIRSFADVPAAPPQMVKTGKLRGYSIAPAFSKDGKQITFARMRDPRYESDKARFLLIPDVGDLTTVEEFFATNDGNGGWDRNPEWITWSHDGKELFFAAEMHGRAKLWKLPSSPREAKQLPEVIHQDGSVTAAKLLGDGPSLFITTRSLVESSNYSILDPATKTVTEVSSIYKHGRSYGLNRSQRDEIWYPGSAGYDNHALVVKPSDFDASKKYPIAFLIHGGPQSAWTDDWSSRWNPVVFAEQGYVAVLPNPTGSTGYDQRHVDAITCNWGGSPYEDLVKCFEYLEQEVGYVDTSRAVALGASYGGYMINWIQGHDLGRKFKALVCHDGVFSTQNQWSTEELFFPMHDFGGTLWESRDKYAEWDPSLHLHRWETPQLVIHNELDYRLPISEGLAMFNVLQVRGVPSKLLVFPDENHWVTKPENSLVWHREVLAWINKYSGVAEEKAG